MVLDSMHNAYYKMLAALLKVDRKQMGDEIVREHTHLVDRYKEYDAAMEENRGPNWLHPLASHMLDNLREEKAENLLGIIEAVPFTSLMKVLPELINSYEVSEIGIK